MRHFAALSFTAWLFVSTASAQVPAGPGDYPQWRGANRDGISSDKGLLKEWPESGPAIHWRVDNVGVGYSSIAIKDGVIVTMGDLDGVEHIIALSADDGSRLWAVQPEPVIAALQARVDQEFKNMDRNSDGKVDELEALEKFGLEFAKFDQGNADSGERAAKVLQSLDANSDGSLSFAEAGRQLRDGFSKIDSSDKSRAEELAQVRTASLMKDADENGDGKIDRKESRNSYLGVIFGRADKRDAANPRGDSVLTEEELVQYFQRREPGKDGQITSDELSSYYQDNISSGDGILSREEMKCVFGGYRNGQGDGPRGTPTIDGNRVYVEGGNGDVACLDLASGKTIWHVNLVEDFGGRRPGWGYSESPLVVNDWVVVTPGGDKGTVLALDKNTGKPIWQSKENTERAHYSSPIVTAIGGIEQIVQFANQSAFGVALADGRLLWKYDGANNGTANCCTPIVDQDHVFVASAYGTGGGLAKIKTSGTGQSAQEVYFEKKMAIHHGGIVKIGDDLYTCGGGTLICIDFLSGDIQWQSRSVGKGSITAADGMLYVQSERQELALVEASPDEYRETGRIKWESQGRPSWAHPVVAGGKLYVRDQNVLWAYDVSE